MRLIIISGLSGSGKSVALNSLEDDGYYCVDNLPTSLLKPLIDRLRNSRIRIYDRVAVGIDARSDRQDLEEFAQTRGALRELGIEPEIVFLQTEVRVLVRRFSETRRKHPLSRKGIPLLEAIDVEKALLAPILEAAELVVDTSQLNVHQLRDLVRERLRLGDQERLSILFQSFGFKNSVPGDTDFVFDVRCLPNPHWEPQLRRLTGRDRPVIEYLERFPEVERMFETVRDFLQQWIPSFESENRAYITVSVGCTGGQHRSVYIAQRLYGHFRQLSDSVSLRHRELE